MGLGAQAGMPVLPEGNVKSAGEAPAVREANIEERAMCDRLRMR